MQQLIEVGGTEGSQSHSHDNSNLWYAHFISES